MIPVTMIIGRFSLPAAPWWTITDGVRRLPRVAALNLTREAPGQGAAGRGLRDSSDEFFVRGRFRVRRGG